MNRLAIFGALPLLLMIALPAGGTEWHVYEGQSIQAAVDGAAPGDTITVHAGEYNQSVVIQTDGLTLRGLVGAILDGTPPADLGTSLGWHGIKIRANHTNIKGLEIREYTGPGYGRGNGILSWSWPGDDAFSFNTVENCRIHDNRWAAVLVGNHGIGLHEGWNIRNNVVYGHKYSSIAIINGKDCKIEQNEVTGGEVGILVMACNSFENELTSSGIEVVGNTVSTATGDPETGNFGIGVAMIAINPDIDELPDYVPVPGASAVLEDIMVRDNHVYESSGGICSGGICVGAVPAPEEQYNVVRLAVMEENEVNGNTGCGIAFAYVDEATVSGNVVYGNGTYSIAMVNGKDCYIQQNEVTGGEVGILVSACNSFEGSGELTSWGIEVADNTVSDAAGELGIGVAAVAINPDTSELPDYVPVEGAWAVLKDVTVRRNWVRQSSGGTYGGGMVLGGVPVPDGEDNVVEGAVVGDNDVRNNTGYGIVLLHVDHSKVVKNRVMQNTVDGIAIDLESLNNQVERNNVRGSDRYGISLMGSSSRNTISRNTAFTSGQFDLYWDFSGTQNRWWGNHYKTKNFPGPAAGGEGRMANLEHSPYSEGAYILNPLAIAAVGGALLPREERLPQDAQWGSPPLVFALAQNSPNPCGQFTIINCQLPMPGDVTLAIYDITGRLVETLIDGRLSAGAHKVRWETGDAPSGIYFYRLRSGGLAAMRKMIVLK